MKRRKINIFFLIIWLIIIFIMSSFNASESSNQSGFIVNLLIKLFHTNNIELISVFVRKTAHFMEYFILGLLCIGVCKDKKNIYIALLFCILYAVSDEVHQIFVHGRAFKVMDIIIDSFGAFCGICLLKGKFDKNG